MQTAFDLGLVDPIATVAIVGRSTEARNRFVRDLLMARGQLATAAFFGLPETGAVFGDWLPNASQARTVKDLQMQRIMHRRRTDQNGPGDPVDVQTIVFNRLSQPDAIDPPNAGEDDGDTGGYLSESVRRLINNARHYRLSLVILEDSFDDIPPSVRNGLDWTVWFPPADDLLTEQIECAADYFPSDTNVIEAARTARNNGRPLVNRRIAIPVHRISEIPQSSSMLASCAIL